MAKTITPKAAESAQAGPKSERRKQAPLLIAAAGLLLALVASPLLAPGADAARDAGGFCIQAVSDEGEFTGTGGGCVVAPSEPAPAGTTEMTMFQKFTWDLDLTEIGQVTWLDGKSYDFDMETASFTNGLPAFLKQTKAGTGQPNFTYPSIACADSYDSCGVRTTVVDTRTGEVIAEAEDTNYLGNGQSWQTLPMLDMGGFKDGHFSTVVDGILSLEEALALPEVGQRYDAEFLRGDTVFFAVKNGEEIPMGTTTNSFGCEDFEFESENANGNKDLLMNRDCRIA
ncbi:hypothetical protein [Frigoribacterium sp. SL97]|uniref:hypothetical protein n=1 Tax=Frigoribacterium sp. SL97 TaxID=2994664 RepID=UPI002271F1DE|nr:hypothetical protein [Frigoribacterium sp. SL97]WAC53234.1 hypothetical protein OVA02_08405 [Frigoribacterium sp. SL97]